MLEAGQIVVSAHSRYGGGPVKRAKQVNQSINVFWRNIVGCYQLEKHSMQGQSPHQYQPVHGLSGGWQLGFRDQSEGAIMPLQCHHAEIDGRRHTRIEPDFFPAIELARLEGCEIEKWETHRLL